MLKKKWNYFIILLAVFIADGCKEINKSSEINFEVEDIATITKIFLADRHGNTITLDKNGKDWRVNNQFEVRKDAILTLLSTIRKIRIKKPISNNAFDNVVKYMATNGISVEIFSDDKMIKAYIIGSDTPDHLGTYMMLRNTNKPYIVHIPSFNGFLSPRYGVQGNALDINTWRSTSVFNLSIEDIKFIKFTDLLSNANSYLLSTKPINIRDYNNQLVDYNEISVLKLMNGFESLNCESFKDGKKNIDFANQLEELIVNSDTLRTYEISKLDFKHKEDNFTVARKYATLNNGETMLIQDYVFNKVLININELKK